MVLDEYVTFRNIIYREGDETEATSTPYDEELYSSHSIYRSPEAPGKLNAA
jgi:hypothetical protein